MLTLQQTGGILWIILSGTIEILWGYLKLFIPSMFLPKKDLSKEIVLITGSGNGIGRELAKYLSKFGCTLVLWDIDESGNRQTLDEVTRIGGKAYTYTVDVTIPERVYSTAQQVVRDIGDVTILINNAGILNLDGVMNIPDNKVKKLLDVNVYAPILIVKAFLPPMLENNHGHIVNLASVAGYVGFPGLSDYCASKHAVVGFTDSLDMELQSMGKSISCLKVALTYVNTAMTTEFPEKITPKGVERPAYLDPGYVAEKIVDAIQTDQSFLLLPMETYLLLALKVILPSKILHKILTRYFWDPSSLLTTNNRPVKSD